MGSSMVTMWQLLDILISCIMAARVVDFPWPVGPVTKKKALTSSCDIVELFGEDEVFYEAYRFRYDPECHGHVAPLEETVTP